MQRELKEVSHEYPLMTWLLRGDSEGLTGPLPPVSGLEGHPVTGVQKAKMQQEEQGHPFEL